MKLVKEPLNHIISRKSFLTVPAMIKMKEKRNGRSQMFFKIGVLKNFAKFTGKYLCQSLFFNKVTG